jgi:hypothetical protein
VSYCHLELEHVHIFFKEKAFGDSQLEHIHVDISLSLGKNGQQVGRS